MNAEQQSKQWGQIVAKAWADEGFKKRLVAEPAAVLKENGLEVAPGFQVKVVEDTGQVCHLTLPAKPSTGELSEEDLDRIGGGRKAGSEQMDYGSSLPPICAPTPDGRPPPSSCAMCQT